MQNVFIPVPNDLTEDTLYYETQFRRVGDIVYSQKITNAPLPDYALASPWGLVPYIELTSLEDATAYEYMCRRFDPNSNYSPWTTGTFTTP